MKKTKIVCTIGPSSWDPKVMREMINAGMNCARVNGAFADEAEIDKVTKLVRDVSDEVSLMMDVKGPEVRMNKFAEPIIIHEGDKIVIGNGPKDNIYPANYKNLYKVLSPGQRIVVGDGDVELTIKKIVGDQMTCEVVFGELLKPGKALNLPGATFASSALTEKDIVNLKYAIKKDWDFVSASFVQNAKAAKEIKKHLEGSNMKLIAKIEDQEGIDNIDEILDIVDGIMIARGGLGVELGLEKVPMVQRMLIKKCNEKAKPVITATQMLESMTTNPKPTRAEVNDVATAILLGTDSVMLSGESSAGKYPVEAVEELAKVAKETEPYIESKKFMPHLEEDELIFSVLTNDMTDIINSSLVDKVIVLTHEGKTAKFISRQDLQIPVITLTANLATVKHLSITKGIYPIYFSGRITKNTNLVEESLEYCLENKLINKTDRVMMIGRLGSIELEEKLPFVFKYVNMRKWIKKNN